jgi:hypothetical protein
MIINLTKTAPKRVRFGAVFNDGDDGDDGDVRVHKHFLEQGNPVPSIVLLNFPFPQLRA